MTSSSKKEEEGVFNDCYLSLSSGCFKHIEYDEEGRVIKKVRMTGLTNVLRNLFWPDFKLTKPKKTLYYESKVKKKKSSSNNLDLVRQVDPRTKGTIIHDRIHMLCDPELKDKYHLKHGTQKDGCTEMFEFWMKKNGWEPLGNEIAIADPDTGIATAIDAILYNKKENRIALVEWKTGSPSYFCYSKTGKCKILKDLDNSLFNQAKIQLVMTFFILVKNYKLKYFIDDLVVVHLSEDHVHDYYISKDFIKIAPHIYNIISEERKKKKKTK